MTNTNVKLKPAQMASSGVVKRMTKQRKIIKDILCSSKKHPTAELIHEEARKVLPDISLGTVYRNLQVLLEEKSIVELSYGKKFSRFDGNVNPHCHFVCETCGNVYDVAVPFDDQFLQNVENNLCGKLSYHRLEFYGVCSACLGAFAGQKDLEAIDREHPFCAEEGFINKNVI